MLWVGHVGQSFSCLGPYMQARHYAAKQRESLADQNMVPSKTWFLGDIGLIESIYQLDKSIFTQYYHRKVK